MLYRFACGCVGRTNDSYRSKVAAFIRVAEIRGIGVHPSDKKCPNHGGK